MNLYYNKTPIRSVNDVVLEFEKREFESPYRSTVPVLSLLKHEEAMISEILDSLGIPEPCSLHLEYQVDPQGGMGKPSQTDLMAKSEHSLLAIEAKWTEPMYETVGEWLDSANRLGILEGWLEMLRPYSRRTLRAEDFKDVAYQMVHRAASACCEGVHPKLGYLLFFPSPLDSAADPDCVLGELHALWKLLGCPDTFPFYLIKVNIRPTTAFDSIAPLRKGEAETAPRIISALSSDIPLFDFENHQMIKV